MFSRMREDIQSVLERDPAALSGWHVGLTYPGLHGLTYPGLHALWGHRLAHRLWRGDWRLLALIVARLARW